MKIRHGRHLRRICAGVAVLVLFSAWLAGQTQESPTASQAVSQQAKMVSKTVLVPSANASNDVPQPNEFVIGSEDILAISVWKEAEISRTIPVRSDGKISLPLVGEVVAAGKTPSELQRELTADLGPYISEPAVTVIVEEIKSKKFNILGHVQKPGAYPLAPPMTVVDAIAMAGGFRDFAKLKDIYVLRVGADGRSKRLSFNYKEVVRGNHSEQNILLVPRDTIIVP